jgi:secreted trypsin-like serine protease
VLALAALALACALAPGASASTGGISPKIVNGSDASITDFPFQVALFDPSHTPSQSQYCGGVIRDATHVITAAHCVFDVFNPGQVSDLGEVGVLAGTNDLASTDPPAVVVTASAVSFDPLYDPNTNTHDVAIITISGATPLWDTSPPANIKPITLIDHANWTLLAPGDDFFVSGWGDMSEEPVGGSGTPSFSNILQAAQVPLVDDTVCGNEYGAAGVPVDRTLLFCAGDHDFGAGITDSCQGDSGGPIVRDQAPSPPPHQFVLVGLVDSGIGCAQPGFPGIYTRLDNADLRTYFASNPPPAPSQNTPTTISGGNQPGQTLTCNAGTWSDPAASVTYRFFRTTGAALTSASPTRTTYTIQPADLGSHILCEVEVKNDGGYGFGESASVLVPVPPPSPPPPPPAKDSVAPKLRITSKKCTRTSCTLKVHVTDAAPSSGIAKVRATLSFRRKVKCRSRAGAAAAKTCTKRVRRALRVSGGAGGRFTIVARRLAPGRGYTISLVPFDKAGNRPRFPTITNVRTKPRHTRGLA